ncbi:hypothetical protein [Desulfovibrio desulfuricans]|uniref:hypothetical protein n=1 Tax=Desulfovibrio desulfuricans TaxID=876 RepID=UPI0003B451D6|nr:hypothetical protein [Desulfovibrio desulfuricans]MDD3684666.1 hypothetical protein [Desulfovibrio desulfuricans]QTO39402.1 hypothetical protein J8J02_09655 [Desulfovibrio desulfuricans]
MNRESVRKPYNFTRAMPQYSSGFRHVLLNDYAQFEIYAVFPAVMDADQAKAAALPGCDADSIMPFFDVIIPINLKIALTDQAMNKPKSDNSIIYG